MERRDLTFADLGVIDPILRRLEEAGFEHPFPIQAQALPDALEGRDVLGKAKTGSGKTLAFGIPIVQRMDVDTSGVTQALVLVPTRELCSQVTEDLEMITPDDVRVHPAFGGSGMAEDLKYAKGADIIVATPGRLIDLLERKAADLSGLQILVIDEADRMADMGFLPQVGKILSYVPKEKKRQTMLFSATLDNQIAGLMAQTNDPVRHEVSEDMPTVEGVEHFFFEVHEMDRDEVLKRLLSHAHGSVLVFCRTKRGCDRLARRLRDDGIDATPIHGDLGQRDREKALSRFEKGQVQALIATDVAARGLDISGISHIINFDPPEDHKTYVHRVGRTARAGATGVGITLCTHEDRIQVERMARALHLEPNVEEIYSTDPRLERIGAGELEGVDAKPQPKEPAMAGIYGKLRRGRRR